MKSRLPKVLHEICGRPMLQWVLDACYDAGVSRVLVVVGHGRAEVMAAFEHDTRIRWIEQFQQLGTGHAARACVPELTSQASDVFIVAGDGPLIRGSILRELLRVHRGAQAAATMATAILEDPKGYGRVIRDENGEFLKIVEQGDGTPPQLAIKEVFPSYYCVRSADLVYALDYLKSDNAKNEFYLTDIFEHLRAAGRRVVAMPGVAAEDVLAVNTRVQQAQVDAIMQNRLQNEYQEAGVTIVSTAATYIEAGATIGPDTIIQPFSFIGREATIGADCVIGPFACVPRQSVVPVGLTLAGNAAATSEPLGIGEKEDKRRALNAIK